MDFTMLCVKALVLQTFVLPEANASSPTEFSGSFPACRVAVCSFRAPWSRNGVQTGNSISNAYQEFPRTSLSVRGFSDVLVALRPLCLSTPTTWLAKIPNAFGPEALARQGTRCPLFGGHRKRWSERLVASLCFTRRMKGCFREFSSRNKKWYFVYEI